MMKKNVIVHNIVNRDMQQMETPKSFLNDLRCLLFHNKRGELDWMCVGCPFDVSFLMCRKCKERWAR
jgi:hypothetical protein